MKKKKGSNRLLLVMLVISFVLSSSLIHAQKNYTISGTVTDEFNGETLFGTSIFLKGTSIGVITNEYGFYSISAPEGS